MRTLNTRARMEIFLQSGSLLYAMARQTRLRGWNSWGLTSALLALLLCALPAHASSRSWTVINNEVTHNLRRHECRCYVHAGPGDGLVAAAPRVGGPGQRSVRLPRRNPGGGASPSPHSPFFPQYISGETCYIQPINFGSTNFYYDVSVGTRLDGVLEPRTPAVPGVSWGQDVWVAPIRHRARPLEPRPLTCMLRRRRSLMRELEWVVPALRSCTERGEKLLLPFFVRACVSWLGGVQRGPPGRGAGLGWRCSCSALVCSESRLVTRPRPRCGPALPRRVSRLFVSGTCLQTRDNGSAGCSGSNQTVISGPPGDSDGTAVGTSETSAQCNQVFSSAPSGSSLSLASIGNAGSFDSGSVCGPSSTGYFFLQSNCPSTSRSLVTLEVSITAYSGSCNWANGMGLALWAKIIIIVAIVLAFFAVAMLFCMRRRRRLVRVHVGWRWALPALPPAGLPPGAREGCAGCTRSADLVAPHERS